MHFFYIFKLADLMCAIKCYVFGRYTMYFNVKPTKFPIKYCVTLENMLPLYTIFFYRWFVIQILEKHLCVQNGQDQSIIIVEYLEQVDYVNNLKMVT